MNRQLMLLLIMTVVLTILFVAGCGTPAAAPVAEAPLPTAIPLPAVATPTPVPATVTTPTLPPTATGDLKLTILFDNYPFDSRLSTQWGFAALVEYHGHTLLFDTGANGSMLLDNMKQLGADPRSVEAIIISHVHDDHTGGLQALLDTGSRPTVYTPLFAGPLKSVGAQTKLVEVKDALEIFPGVHTTGPVNKEGVEQALVVETRDGTVVITGCAHPGGANMVRQAQEIVPGKIALLAGGFHLYATSKEELPSIIAELRQLGVEKVLPCHCTGDEAITLFRTEYGESYIEGGVGRTVTLPGKKLG